MTESMSFMRGSIDSPSWRTGNPACPREVSCSDGQARLPVLHRTQRRLRDGRLKPAATQGFALWFCVAAGFSRRWPAVLCASPRALLHAARDDEHAPRMIAVNSAPARRHEQIDDAVA